jgi:hypothetical protein
VRSTFITTYESPVTHSGQLDSITTTRARLRIYGGSATTRTLSVGGIVMGGSGIIYFDQNLDVTVNTGFVAQTPLKRAKNTERLEVVPRCWEHLIQSCPPLVELVIVIGLPRYQT